MKKIKYIFWIWLLGALFSTCFWYSWVNSMFSYIDLNWQTYWYMVWYDSWNYNIWVSPHNWFNTSRIPVFTTLNSLYSLSFTWRHLSSITESFLTPVWFNITWTNQNWEFSLISSNLSNSLYESINVDYTVRDTFPFVVNKSNWSYLTFENDSTIIYNWQSFPIINQWVVHFCFYWKDMNLSCVVSTPNSDPWFKFISFWVDDSFNFHQYDNYAIIPIHKQDWNYNDYIFTWYWTLVLSYWNYNSMQNLWIIWNYFDCYSSEPEVLKSCILWWQWYIDISPNIFFSRTFLSFIWNSNNLSNYWYWSFAEILQTWWNFIFRSNSYYNTFSSLGTSSTNLKSNCYYGASCFGSWTLPLISDSSVDNILEHNSNQPVQTNSWVVSSSSLYYACLWPVYNTPDWLPPEFCYNSSWELDSDRFRNCYDSINSNSDYYSYCVIDWYVQTVDLVPDWSWYAIVSHDWPITNILEVLQNYSTWWYTTWYFENYLNSTWLFFKCPWPYDNNLTIWPKLITFLNWYDLLLPINCWIAWFSYWRNIINFENSWHFVPDWPLLNFDGDNRKMLYLFFDIVMSLWIVIFAWKIFYLFHK